MEKFILANNYGKGFITHEDQEQNFLKFLCLGNSIVKVIGEENKIVAWMNRVGGSEINEVDASLIIDAKEKVNKLKRIQVLKDELLILENEVK